MLVLSDIFLLGGDGVIQRNFFVQDNSEVKKNELKLSSISKAFEWLRYFAQAVSDISCMIDEDGRIIEIFANNDRGLNRAKAEIVNRKLSEVFSKDLAERVLLNINNAIVTGIVQHMEADLDTLAGRRQFACIIAPMECLVQSKRTIALVLTDVTEKKRSERKRRLIAEIQRKNELLNGIIDRKLSLEQQAAAADKLGIRLISRLSCYLIVIEKNYCKENSGLINDIIIKCLSDDKDMIAWHCREGIGILYPVPVDCEHIKQYEDSFASNLQGNLYKNFSDIKLKIGISEFQPNIINVVQGYQQAFDSIRIGQKIRPEQGIYHYCDFEVMQVIAQIINKEKKDEFIQRTLGKLLEYDKIRGTDLVKTLEIILCSDKLKNAANKLFCHQKTIVFRKKRIEKILKVDLGDFDTRLMLSIALKLMYI